MKRKVLIDRDKFNNADQKAVAGTTVRIFDRIQDYSKEVQLLSLAAAFYLAAEAARIPAQDAFTAVTNIMRDPTHATGRGAQFAAMKYHLETEVYA